MKPTLNVYALPRFVEPEEMAGGTAVVIDVLRATTTIVHALDAGADEIIPCLEVADALALAGRFPADEVVLGGERHGLPIEGFQLGNSPDEYTPDRVGGKTVVLTTTNGTRAMIHARQADEVLIAAFVNASAVVRRLFDREHVHILCAGTDGKISEDDVLLAGLLVERLQRQGEWSISRTPRRLPPAKLGSTPSPLPQALGAEPLDPDRLADEVAQEPRGAEPDRRWAWTTTSWRPLNSTASISCRGSIPRRCGSRLPTNRDKAEKGCGMRFQRADLGCPKDRLLTILRPHGQEHLLAFWDTLDPAERESLARQIEAIDFGLIRRLYEGRDQQGGRARIGRPRRAAAGVPPGRRAKPLHAATGPAAAARRPWRPARSARSWWPAGRERGWASTIPRACFPSGRSRTRRCSRSTSRRSSPPAGATACGFRCT